MSSLSKSVVLNRALAAASEKPSGLLPGLEVGVIVTYRSAEEVAAVTEATLPAYRVMAQMVTALVALSRNTSICVPGPMAFRAALLAAESWVEEPLEMVMLAASSFTPFRYRATEVAERVSSRSL